MRQEEYFDKINCLLDKIIKNNCPPKVKMSLSGDYSKNLSELIQSYPNERTFNFLIEIIKKLYERKMSLDFDSYRAIDITLISLHTFFER